GLYHPPTLADTVTLCADLLLLFEEQHISVIRLGLHDSDSLRQEQLAGVFHPAFRELCESEILYRHTLEVLQQHNITGGTVIFAVHPSSVSRFVGQKRQNIQRLSQIGITAVVRQNHSLSKYQVSA
ncbi:MAG TPA: radical SAM protein, partial [Ruminococcaceae bacterium]|nr:radical SAM protein [Oscillospiraceae bacterium]